MPSSSGREKRFFFRPDYTVGIGISPIQSCDSWTVTTGEEFHLALKNAS